MRSWAGERGIDVSDRGRVPAALVRDFLASRR
ncbi:Lsr2 family protein [Rhodococcus sp. RD6.2]